MSLNPIFEYYKLENIILVNIPATTRFGLACKKCDKNIRSSQDNNSNWIAHLRTVHPELHTEFQKKQRVKRNKATPVAPKKDAKSNTPTNLFKNDEPYPKKHPTQVKASFLLQI